MRAPSKLHTFGLHAFLILATFLTLYPVLWVLKMALAPGQGFALSANPFPTEFTLDNFRALLFAQDMEGHWLFAHQLWNSTVVALVTTVIGLCFASTAAYAFSRLRFPGREAGMNLLLVTQMFPGVVMMIPLYIILEKLNLLNSLSGMALVYSTTALPFCVWMLKGYFDTIPKDLEEAAVMDGMDRFSIFLKILVPLARPGIVVTGLFSFMTAWNEFILAATFLSDPTAFTLPVALQQYVGDYNTEWGRFAAGAVLVSIPVMALFFALQRHLVGGLTAGSVKG